MSAFGSGAGSDARRSRMRLERPTFWNSGSGESGEGGQLQVPVNSKVQPASHPHETCLDGPSLLFDNAKVGGISCRGAEGGRLRSDACEGEFESALGETWSGI